MSRKANGNVLHVEGKDDKYTVIHLMSQHGVSFEPANRVVQIAEQENDQGVLEAIEVAVPAGTHGCVGFVLDADVPVEQRWAQVRGRLSPFQIELPPLPPPEGFVADVPLFKTRVGIWLMPNNVMDYGKIEDLLRTLVPAEDKLIDHAESATTTASERGALFTANDKIKAVLHTWLAWQKTPGCPYGTAVKAAFFGKASEVALRFVNWFKLLFRLI